MRFVEIINKKKFTLISIFLFLYVIFNLLEGERGLISYYEKQKIKKELIQEKKQLVAQLYLFEKKIDLLTKKIDYYCFSFLDFGKSTNIKYEDIPILCDKFKIKKNLIKPLYLS